MSSKGKVPAIAYLRTSSAANVGAEAIKSVVAVGLGASIVPSLCLGAGHVSNPNMIVRPLSPSAVREVGLVKLRDKRNTEAMKLAAAAILTLRKRG